MAPVYDLIVIGGGITGAGILRDAAMRGLKALLLEKGAAGQATTAASSRLIHGGLRYLLYDRLTTHTTSWDSGNIVRIARPLLTRLPILWPVYRGHAHGLETVEALMAAYDRFAPMKEGKPHLRFSAAETLKLIPGLRREGLLGAVCFDEWRVDPVSLVRGNLESARALGAQFRMGEEVVGLTRESGRVTGVRSASGEIRARLVINASGPWVDQVARLAGVSIPLRLRQGVHLVYDRPLTPLGLILQAPDRRYVFVLPQPSETLLGPTDVPGPQDPERLTARREEIDYLLDTVVSYLPSFPRDYRRAIVGARPILGQSGSEKLLSREFETFDHEARDGVAGLLTIGGGKMSDFRLMAEAATDLACSKLGSSAACRTHLETLDGTPVEGIPSFPRPWRPLKRFLRKHPRLRELHALTHLGSTFARHLLARARGARLARAEELGPHYAELLESPQ